MKILKFVGLIIFGFGLVWLVVYLSASEFRHDSNEVKKVFEDLVNSNRGITKVKYENRDFVIIELKDECSIYSQLDISIKCLSDK